MNQTKTLVRGRHELGPAINGYDYCYARVGSSGLCPGHQTAAWLNGLGPDEALYIGKTTCGDVRRNYLRAGESSHITAIHPELAALRERRARLLTELRTVERDIASSEAVIKAAADVC